MHVEGAACGDSNLSVKLNSSVKSDSKLPDTVDGNIKGKIKCNHYNLNVEYAIMIKRN